MLLENGADFVAIHVYIAFNRTQPLQSWSGAAQRKHFALRLPGFVPCLNISTEFLVDFVTLPRVLRKHRVLVAGVGRGFPALLCSQLPPRGHVPRLDLSRRVAVKPVIFLSQPAFQFPVQRDQLLKPRLPPQFKIQCVAFPLIFHIPVRILRSVFRAFQPVHFPLQFFVAGVFILIFLAQLPELVSALHSHAFFDFSGFIVPCCPVFRAAAACKALSALDGVLDLMYQRVLRRAAQALIHADGVAFSVVLALRAARQVRKLHFCLPQLRIGAEQFFVVNDVFQCGAVAAYPFIHPVIFHPGIVDLKPPLSIRAGKPAGFLANVFHFCPVALHLHGPIQCIQIRAPRVPSGHQILRLAALRGGIFAALGRLIGFRPQLFRLPQLRIHAPRQLADKFPQRVKKALCHTGILADQALNAAPVAHQLLCQVGRNLVHSLFLCQRHAAPGIALHHLRHGAFFLHTHGQRAECPVFFRCCLLQIVRDLVFGHDHSRFVCVARNVQHAVLVVAVGRAFVPRRVADCFVKHHPCAHRIRHAPDRVLLFCPLLLRRLLRPHVLAVLPPQFPRRGLLVAQPQFRGVHLRPAARQGQSRRDQFVPGAHALHQFSGFNVRAALPHGVACQLCRLAHAAHGRAQGKAVQILFRAWQFHLLSRGRLCRAVQVVCDHFFKAFVEGFHRHAVQRFQEFFVAQHLIKRAVHPACFIVHHRISAEQFFRYRFRRACQHGICHGLPLVGPAADGCLIVVRSRQRGHGGQRRVLLQIACRSLQRFSAYLRRRCCTLRRPAADLSCQVSARRARFFSQRRKRRSAGLSENAARHGGNSLLHKVVVQFHQELSQCVVFRQLERLFHLLLRVPVLLLPGCRLPGVIRSLCRVLLCAGRKRPRRLLAHPHGRAHGVLRRRNAAQSDGCQCPGQLLRPLLCRRLRALPHNLRVDDLLARIHIKNCVVLLPGRALHGAARAHRREDLLLRALLLRLAQLLLGVLFTLGLGIVAQRPLIARPQVVVCVHIFLRDAFRRAAGPVCNGFQPGLVAARRVAQQLHLVLPVLLCLLLCLPRRVALFLRAVPFVQNTGI